MGIEKRRNQEPGVEEIVGRQSPLSAFKYQIDVYIDEKPFDRFRGGGYINPEMSAKLKRRVIGSSISADLLDSASEDEDE